MSLLTFSLVRLYPSLKLDGYNFTTRRVMTFTNTTISLICSTYKKWELLSFSIRVQVQSQRLKFEQILILCLFRRFVYILYTYGPVVPHQGPKIQKSLSKPKKWKSRVSMSRFHDYICWREKKPLANFQVWVIHKFWEIMEIYLIFWFLFLLYYILNDNGMENVLLSLIHNI